jgi:hypothetical protein
MSSTNLLDGFDLIKIKSVTRATGSIRISKDKKSMNISTKYMRELGWKNKERVNLRCCGSTFALEPDKVGLITVHLQNGGGIITSTNFCLEVLSRTRSCREYEGWVEQGILFFKPKRGEDE